MAATHSANRTRRMLVACAAAGLTATGLIAAAPPPAGTLIVTVGNVRNAAGRIHVDVCPQAQFLKEDCRWSAETAAHAGVSEITIRGLPAGRYAVQVTHDENGNRKVDRNLLGIPREGIGFSRDARIRLAPPRWDDAVIAFDGRAARIALRLRYFLGPSGPNPL